MLYVIIVCWFVCLGSSFCGSFTNFLVDGTFEKKKRFEFCFISTCMYIQLEHDVLKHSTCC